MGCVDQGGEQALHIGRNAVLASSLPRSVPAVSIDRQCGSSQQAIQFAAQAVLSGTQDVVIAAGVESMTRVPMGSTAGLAIREPGSRRTLPRHQLQPVHGRRDDRREARLRPQRARRVRTREPQACGEGHVGRRVSRVRFFRSTSRRRTGRRAVHDKDEGIRYDATDRIDRLRAFVARETAGSRRREREPDLRRARVPYSSSPERALKEHNLTPLARVHNLTVTGGDPVIMLEEPLFATDRALKRAGMTIDDIDLYEVNEAFAPVPLAWLKHTGADPEKLNVNGGAILARPSARRERNEVDGDARARVAARAAGKYGLQTMCEGGGLANVTIIRSALGPNDERVLGAAGNRSRRCAVPRGRGEPT